MSAYESLRTLVATRTRRVVIWCGAGLSASAGLPTWTLLQRRLEAKLADKLSGQEGATDATTEQRLRGIRQESNPWVAFQRLQTELGLTTFREAIREVFAKAHSVDVPEVYKSLWKLKPAGFINLNIDRLATRAGGGEQSSIIEFKGKEVGRYTYTLNAPRPFVCNMHGVEEDFDSWVFTRQAIKELMDSSGYKEFVNASLITTTVIFVGITADDIAVGGHLERLVAAGITPQTHYWITDRRDKATDAWAEKNNIRIVSYKPTTSAHAELVQMLEELAGYVQPEEGPSPPVAFELNLDGAELEPINEIVKKDPEVIRSVLNAHAYKILKESGKNAVQEYEDFSRKYDRAIHSAWYTSTDPGENKFLGLNLLSEKSRGAFGIVFRAMDEDGKELAVKLLHAEIRRKTELLDAFRRGVRSMRILTEKEVDGMVGFKSASEIPATLIMDWIEGPNLNEFVATGVLAEWDVLLEISSQLAGIISSAHALPERVLHRDVRPPNLMLADYWDTGEIKLKVLDFDLSWHRGSVEKSVIFGSQLSGYLAPEQVQRKNGVSTQHASVDSYGIGMTIFYMASGRDPSPGEHAYKNWTDSLNTAVQRMRAANWKSLPARMARLIASATQEEQARRWDVIQLRSELNRLRDANRDPESVASAELLAEEISARCSLMSRYEWRGEDLSVGKNFGTGLTVSLSGNETSQEVNINLVRTSTEADNRNKLKESILSAKDNVYRALKDGGWIVSSDVGKGMLTMRAHISVASVAGRMSEIVESVQRAIEYMVFK